VKFLPSTTLGKEYTLTFWSLDLEEELLHHTPPPVWYSAIVHWYALFVNGFWDSFPNQLHFDFHNNYVCPLFKYNIYITYTSKLILYILLKLLLVCYASILDCEITCYLSFIQLTTPPNQIHKHLWDFHCLHMTSPINFNKPMQPNLFQSLLLITNSIVTSAP